MKRKTLRIDITAHRYGLLGERQKIGASYTYQVTGSALSIRRAEAAAVAAFLKEQGVGSCSVTSKIVEDDKARKG